MRLLLPFLLMASPLLAEPNISSIYPASGPESGGTFVHIVGSDLIGLPLACPALECGNFVKFGDSVAAISINGYGEIVAVSPSHPPGPVDITVNIAGKAKITIPDAFRFESSGSEFEQILLPLVGDQSVGAFGSTWKTEVILHNASTDDIPLRGANCSPLILTPCPLFHLPPLSTVTSTIFNAPDFEGAFLYVPRVHDSDVDVLIRVQDTSRKAQTWGATLPIVRPIDFRRSVRLNGVPTDTHFRSTLRIYGYSVSNDFVAVRIFDPASPQPLVETDLPLRVWNPSDDRFPSYARLDFLSDAFHQIQGHETVRVEIQSNTTPPKPIWAFLTVTNNDTQQVTVIAPSP